jgi:hypothetical protein
MVAICKFINPADVWHQSSSANTPQFSIKCRSPCFSFFDPLHPLSDSTYPQSLHHIHWADICECMLASHLHQPKTTSLLFQLRINLCHFRINCDAAICQADQLQLQQYDWECSQDSTDVVVIPTKTNYGDKKYGTVHSDCHLYNTEIWSDYKISAGSMGFTWIFLLTSTFHLQIATHKEPCSAYPTWASCYLSVHRKMKKE